MRRKFKPLLAGCFITASFSTTIALAGVGLLAPTNPSALKPLVKFLTDKATFQGNGTFMTVQGKLPRSYYSDTNYWGAYVCGVYGIQKGLNCRVTDWPRMENGNFVLNGLEKDGAALQVERMDATYGTDIYDAATWQIAIALAAKNNLLSTSTAKALISNVNKRLARQDVRGTASTFQYGYKNAVSDPKSAYALRMLGDSFLETDPLLHSFYKDYISFKGSEQDKQKLFGKISWSDWKPITGENAWAFFIGPLQADNIQYGVGDQNAKSAFVPFAAPSIQQAIQVLSTFQLMQAPNGGIYYAPGGSQGNEGSITKGSISTENTISTLAGLAILQKTLNNTLIHDPAADKAKIQTALKQIDSLINGDPQTKGIVAFLKNDVWNGENNTFLQGGVYANEIWTKTHSPQAVDVNTWGIAALTPKTIDTWHGKGTAFQMWQTVKTWGGYCGGGACTGSSVVDGVGFSDKDNNQVMSAEWTFGAITALKSLVRYYQDPANGINATQLASLKADLANMEKFVQNLRTDRYGESAFKNALGTCYQVKLPQGEVAFLYASKRYHIPFGWFANPIPSTTSTSWAVMDAFRFNPFQYPVVIKATGSR